MKVSSVRLSVCPSHLHYAAGLLVCALRPGDNRSLAARPVLGRKREQCHVVN